jgi:putative transposase
VEFTTDLGCKRHAVEGRRAGDSRDGFYPKSVTTESGQAGLQVPRGRTGTFDSAPVPNGQHRREGLSAKVISPFAKCITTGELRAHLAEIYGTEISRDTISQITES